MNDYKDLNNKTFLISGSSGHLGQKICSNLINLGCNLILVDRYESDLSKQLIDKYDYHRKTTFIKCDFELEEDRNAMIQEVLSVSENLYCLINNAAFVGTSEISGWNEPFKNQSLSSWRKALEVNLISPFHLSQSFEKLLSKCEGSNIINIGSIYADMPPDWTLYRDLDMSNPAAYGSSKAGLNYLTKWLASTLSPKIRVNSVSPGGILRKQHHKFIERYNKKVPLGRMAFETDIVGTIIFLSSTNARYITGQNIRVDGGID